MFKMCIKKTLFIASGLASTILIALFVRAYNADASTKEGTKFGDWMVVCEKNASKKQVCFLNQVITSTNEKDSGKSVHIATFRIGYLTQTKNLQMLQILPFGVNIQSGTSVIIGGQNKLIAQGKFTTCQNFGCIAIADLTKQDIQDLTNNKEVYLGVITTEGKQLNINMSTNGLKDGIKALK